MFSRRFFACTVSLLLCSAASLSAPSLSFKATRLTVLGTLTDDLVLGAEASGWTIQLNPVIIVDGKLISSIEIKSSNKHRLASLEDKFVQATGKLIVLSGRNASQRPVFELSSIKEHKSRKAREP